MNAQPDPKQLPYILRLLDDESPEVQAAVIAQLTAFGDALEENLLGLSLPETPGQRRLIESLVRAGRRKRLAGEWLSLAAVAEDKPLLERGLDLIARFLQPLPSPLMLGRLLDDLAREFRDAGCEHDALALGEFLFQTKGLAGAHDSFYNPQNSNLIYVITSRQGLPISLACVYMLVAHRLGLRVEGCNLPGHFLALAEHGGRRFVVDCFNGGVVLLDSDLARLSAEVPVTTGDLAALECDARIIINRVLRNLANAFRRLEDEQAAEDARLMEDLLQKSGNQQE